MTEIYLEMGKKKVFAVALEWPGWARAGKGEKEALEALSAYEKRYQAIAARTGLEFAPGELVVVERAPGDATTDFGAPSIVLERDREPCERAQAEREVAILRAAWEELDA